MERDAGSILTGYVLPSLAVLGGAVATGFGGGAIGIPLILGGSAGIAKSAIEDTSDPDRKVTGPANISTLAPAAIPNSIVQGATVAKTTPVRVGYYDASNQWIVQTLPANKVRSLEGVVSSSLYVNVRPFKGVSEWRPSESAAEGDYVLATDAEKIPAAPLRTDTVARGA